MCRADDERAEVSSRPPSGIGGLAAQHPYRAPAQSVNALSLFGLVLGIGALVGVLVPPLIFGDWFYAVFWVPVGLMGAILTAVGLARCDRHDRRGIAIGLIGLVAALVSLVPGLVELIFVIVLSGHDPLPPPD